MSLRYVDPYAERSWLYRVHGRLVCTRLFQRLALTSVWAAVVWRIDRLLLRLTGGRPRTATPLVTAPLATRGAPTGCPRRPRGIYFHRGERVTIIPSKARRPRKPSSV